MTAHLVARTRVTSESRNPFWPPILSPVPALARSAVTGRLSAWRAPNLPLLSIGLFGRPADQVAAELFWARTWEMPAGETNAEMQIPHTHTHTQRLPAAGRS